MLRNGAPSNNAVSGLGLGIAVSSQWTSTSARRISQVMTSGSPARGVRQYYLFNKQFLFFYFLFINSNHLVSFFILRLGVSCSVAMTESMRRRDSFFFFFLFHLISEISMPEIRQSAVNEPHVLHHVQLIHTPILFVTFTRNTYSYFVSHSHTGSLAAIC